MDLTKHFLDATGLGRLDLSDLDKMRAKAAQPGRAESGKDGGGAVAVR